jgi:hypothetical protein
MAKFNGALENVQIEWFTAATRPTASSWPYRVIYVTDVSQFHFSDGTNWVIIPSGSAANTLAGANTFTGATNINGYLNLGLTTDATNYGTIGSYSNATPVIELTGTVTAISGFANTTSGDVIVLVNRTGGVLTVKNEDTSTPAAQRILTGSTSGNLSVSNNGSVLLTYCGDSRWHVIGGSGSGGTSTGPSEYFTLNAANPNFETNAVTPWVTASAPFSGGAPGTLTTGGSSGITLSINSTTPLNGTYDLLATKPASNVAGTGFISAPLTINREDLGKVLTLTFSYAGSSTNFDVSGSSTQSLEVWIYDQTAATALGIPVWIQPSGYRGMNTRNPGILSATFQSSVTVGQQYRIAILTQQTVTTAYTVEFDSFSLSRVAALTGPAMSDWVAYTPTIVGFGTPTGVQVWSRRVGDSLEISGSFIAGTPTAVTASITMGFNGKNLGVTFDTTKIPTGVNAYLAGHGGVGTATASSFTVLGYNGNAASTLGFGIQGASSAGLAQALGNSMLATSEVFSFYAVVPVAGWASNSAQSSDTDTRVIVAKYAATGASVTANTQTNFDLVISDNTASVTTGAAAWKFTTPVTGTYVVSGSLNFAGIATHYLYKNGVKTSPLVTGVANSTGSYSATIALSAGDTIDIRPDSTQTSNGGTVLTSPTVINIFRLSGPAVVQATESVNGRYFGATATVTGSFSNATYTTKDFDTHSAYSGATLTIPVSGKYQFNAGIAFAATHALNNFGIIGIHKNGTQMNSGAQISGGAETNLFASISDIISCVAGDLITVKVTDSGPSPTIVASNFYNIFSWSRVGN